MRENIPEMEVFTKTVYGESRGESREGKLWVSWVIKNRAYLNKEHFGGSTIKGVCLEDKQFECWNGMEDIVVNETEAYEECRQICESVYYAHISADPTGGADHFNNPDKEVTPGWAKNCVKLKSPEGHHQFYKEIV